MYRTLKTSCSLVSLDIWVSHFTYAREDHLLNYLVYLIVQFGPMLLFGFLSLLFRFG